ncbi:ABC transporter ATP-binding protein [Candidatus Gracilibacteria bacterium]|nr:ABC transporter ATP-binding protein [Candidatus Gracilibacteria bacterium]
MKSTPSPSRPKSPSIFTLLKPYKRQIILLIGLTLATNLLSLALPKIMSNGIDAYTHGVFVLKTVLWEFTAVAFGIFLFAYLQSIVQTYASERVARDLREQLAAKISRQSTSYIQSVSAGKLLTNLTSDIDSIKLFVAQAIVSLVASLCIIIGAAIILITIDWKLALAVLTIVPVIGVTFFLVLSKVRVLFTKTREVIDWLNKVINESILGSSLIRVLNAHNQESDKFMAANTNAKELGVKILNLFATLIPVVTFMSGFATIIILSLGGHFVIAGNMSLGDFAAFNSYVGILIFPIFVIGFMSNVIAQATASYQRIDDVLKSQEREESGIRTDALRGDINLNHVTVSYGEKPALKDVSLAIRGGTKTAIIGPTAAGKTQLLYLLTALIEPQSGNVEYDGRDVHEYDKPTLHQQVGFVFQDSIIFNLTVRENIAFSETVRDEDLKKAIDTAELRDFVDALPNGLDTVVSERGASLSGGQKQRVMLARALALNPKILLLDDFTARVDTNTEKKILANVAKNYPGITLLSVTQKIASIEHYDQIILLMEGEIIAQGVHKDLMDTCPEYVQIYQSQRSTNHSLGTTLLQK